MDRLSNAIDTLVDETCNGLLKPRHLRIVGKECGLELTKEEANEIISEIVTVFRAKLRSGIDEFVEDIGIEKKLADLKVLADECKAKCEELCETVGYRSLGKAASRKRETKIVKSKLPNAHDESETKVAAIRNTVDRDLQGALHPVVSGYHEALTIFNSKLKEDTTIAQKELKRLEEEVSVLAKHSESLMARRNGSET